VHVLSILVIYDGDREIKRFQSLFMMEESNLGGRPISCGGFAENAVSAKLRFLTV
jgi:hypothetical protein